MDLSIVVFGLASALSWGAGDFCGGLAARRASVYGVVIGSQAVGLLLLAALALLFGEPLPPGDELLLAAGAGLAGGLGLVALYRGLALGPMGLVAPVAAVISAAVPALWGTWHEGLPAARPLAGFALALPAVWLVSNTGRVAGVRACSLLLPILAGLGFGLFLIIIDRVSDQAILWPLAVARSSSVVLLTVTAVALRAAARPARGRLPLLVLVGLLDTAGNAFYALAARGGRLDVAAILSSLYPAVTVLFARFFLQEQVAPRQWLGLLAALAAVFLIVS